MQAQEVATVQGFTPAEMVLICWLGDENWSMLVLSNCDGANPSSIGQALSDVLWETQPGFGSLHHAKEISN